MQSETNVFQFKLAAVGWDVLHVASKENSKLR